MAGSLAGPLGATPELDGRNRPWGRQAERGRYGNVWWRVDCARCCSSCADLVVPTYQRRESVRRLLEALGRRTLPPPATTVMVSIDGATDGTREMLRRRASAGLPPAHALRPRITDGDGLRPRPIRGRPQQHRRSSSTTTSRRTNIARASSTSACRSKPVRMLGAVHSSANSPRTAVSPVLGARFNARLAEARATRVPGFTVASFYSGNLSVRRDVLIEAGLFDKSFTVYRQRRRRSCASSDRAQRRGLVYTSGCAGTPALRKAIDRLAADRDIERPLGGARGCQTSESLRSLKLAGYANGPLRWRLARRMLIAVTRVVPSTARAVWSAG